MRGTLAGALLLSGCFAGPPVLLTRSQLRDVTCLRTTQDEAARRAPGRVPPPPARTVADSRTDAFLCTHRVLPLSSRPPREEAVLSGLRREVQGVAERAMALVPDEGVRWLVEAHYPEPEVAGKIAVAARVELAERGRRVTERVPLLSAGDVSVLLDLGVAERFRQGCARTQALSAMADDEVLLDVMLLDPAASRLEAGLCRRGVWRWLP